MPFLKKVKGKKALVTKEPIAKEPVVEEDNEKYVLNIVPQKYRIYLMNYIRTKNDNPPIAQDGFCLGDCAVFAIESMLGRQEEWYQNHTTVANMDNTILLYFKLGSGNDALVVDKDKIDKLQEDFDIYGHLHFLALKKDQPLTPADHEYCKQIYRYPGMKKYFKSNPKDWKPEAKIKSKIKNIDKGLSKKKQGHAQFLTLMEYFNTTTVMQSPWLLAILDELSPQIEPKPLMAQDGYQQSDFPIILNWILGYTTEHNFQESSKSQPVVIVDQMEGDLFELQFEKNVEMSNNVKADIENMLNQVKVLCPQDKLIKIRSINTNTEAHAQLIFYHAETQLFDFFDPNGYFYKNRTAQQIADIIPEVLSHSQLEHLTFSFIGRKKEPLALHLLSDKEFLDYIKMQFIFWGPKFIYKDPEELRRFLTLIKERNSAQGEKNDSALDSFLDNMFLLIRVRPEDYDPNSIVDAIKLFPEFGVALTKKFEAPLLSLLKDPATSEDNKHAIVELITKEFNFKSGYAILWSDLIDYLLESNKIDITDFVLNKIVQNKIELKEGLKYVNNNIIKHQLKPDFNQLIEASIQSGSITKEDSLWIFEELILLKHNSLRSPPLMSNLVNPAAADTLKLMIKHDCINEEDIVNVLSKSLKYYRAIKVADIETQAKKLMVEFNVDSTSAAMPTQSTRSFLPTYKADFSSGSTSATSNSHEANLENKESSKIKKRD